MAVSVTRSISAGLYTPYHAGVGRGAVNGLVGTLQLDAEATGAAGGGTVQIAVSMGREAFGFPLMLVPTFVGVQDNLAAAEVVRVDYRLEGNRRLQASVSTTLTTLRSGTNNAGTVENVSIPIEGVAIAEADILHAVWATNTDTKTYHLHVFAAVFDLQVIAREGLVDLLMAGVR